MWLPWGLFDTVATSSGLGVVWGTDPQGPPWLSHNTRSGWDQTGVGQADAHVSAGWQGRNRLVLPRKALPIPLLHISTQQTPIPPNKNPPVLVASQLGQVARWCWPRGHRGAVPCPPGSWLGA